MKLSNEQRVAVTKLIGEIKHKLFITPSLDENFMVRQISILDGIYLAFLSLGVENEDIMSELQGLLQALHGK